MAQDNNQVVEQSHEESQIIRRYLLGELSESELERVEQRILSDNNFFLNLELAEEDLIDGYIKDALSGDEREKFHSHFLSTPERVQSVKFARALGKYVGRQHTTDLPIESRETLAPLVSKKSFFPFLQTHHPAIRWSLLAALVLAIVGVSWLLFKVLQRPNLSEPLEARKTTSQEQPSPTNQQTSPQPPVDNTQPTQSPQQAPTPLQQEPEVAQANRNQPRTPTPETPQPKRTVYSVLLSPGMVRGDDGATPVEVPKGTSTVSFNLILTTGSYPSYQAQLVKGEQEIRSWNKIKAVTGQSGNYVSVSVPVKYLPKGRYYVLLNGVTPDGEVQEINRYYFRISGN